MNPYEVLGIDPAVDDDEEIRKAYLRAVRDHPPDRDGEGFQRVRRAFETLRDRSARVDMKLFPRPSATSLSEWAETLESPLRRASLSAWLNLSKERAR